MSCGIYIHIPYCRSKCGYCSFNSCAVNSTLEPYLNALRAETVKRADKKLVCDTLYIGGGTPSVLPRGALTSIIADVRNNFKIAQNSEITVEANPESCSREFTQECYDAGVNRISLGLQSDNDILLKKLGRAHNYAQFLAALENVSNAGITNVSADLMLGLPGQSRAAFKKTLIRTAALDLKHISIYALKIEEGTKMYQDGAVVDEDLQAQMYGDCIEILSDHGFMRYEVSNFAKAGYFSRHNSKYWDLTLYIGLGLSAHSYFDGCRLENTDNIIDYISGKTLNQSNKIPLSESAEEYIMLTLRTEKGLDLKRLKDEFKTDLLTEKSKQIDKLVKLNAIFIDKNRLRVCQDAFYILNSIITELI